MSEQNFPSSAGEPSPAPEFSPKKDLMMAAIIGFLCALLIIPIFKNLAPQAPLNYVLALLVVLPILSALGLLVAGWLAKLIKVIYQVAKFILVGTLNTFVDWGVLNLLIFLTAIASGPFYSVFKGAGFVIASINSYFWNKYWTFNKPVSSVSQPGEQKSASKEILQFFVVSLIGFVMNVGVASLIVNWWGPQFGITAKLWANVGALCGTLVGLVWNFLGYKLIVFKS